MKDRIKEPQENMLTQKMDFGSHGFNEFQAILLNKSKKRTDSQKMKIDLLTINYDLALIFGRLFNHNPMLWIEIQAKTN